MLRRSALSSTIILCLLLLFTVVCGASKVDVWVHTFQPHLTFFERVAAQYNKTHPGTTINIVPKDGGGNYNQATVALAAGAGPDIVQLHAHTARSYTGVGFLAPWDGKVSPYDLDSAMDQFISEEVKPFTYKGKLYGLPLATNTRGFGFFAHKPAFAEAGLPIVDQFDDWDQVVQYAKKLVRIGADGNMTRIGLSYRNDGDAAVQWLGMIYEQGGDIWSEAKGGFNFESPEARETLEFIRDMIVENNLDDFTMKGKWHKGLLFQGKAPLTAGFLDAMGNVLAMGVADEYAFIVRPHFGSAPVFASEGAWGLAVTDSSKVKEEAFDFLRYVFSDRVLQDWHRSMMILPSKKSLLADPIFLEPQMHHLQIIASYADNWKFIGEHLEASKVRGSASSALMGVLRDGKDVSQSLSDLTTTLNSELTR